jgi:hypothetical protein
MNTRTYLSILTLGLLWMIATAAYPAGFIKDIRGAESGTRILLVGASYLAPESPPNGAVLGAEIYHPNNGKPFTPLGSVLPQDRIFAILKPAIVKAYDAWAGSFVDPTTLGKIAGFRDWDGVMDQWTDVVNQSRTYPPSPGVLGNILLKQGDVLILGLFNDCIQTLAGTKPLCFDNGQPNEHLNNLFSKLDEVVAKAVGIGLIVYMPGYPNFNNLDLNLTQKVLLPPNTEVINGTDYATLAAEYEAHFSNKPNVVFIRADDIIASHIGDGMHLERKYYEEVARRIMQDFGNRRGYNNAQYLTAELLAADCYYWGISCRRQ